ncbi:MAG: hypothetical protein II854_04755 [Prevotella sp.]|nr:hypothetical protein [Prevotella sp.]
MKTTRTIADRLREASVIAIPVIFICGIAYYFYTIYQESKQQPTVNKILKVGNKYELSDTLFYCDKYPNLNSPYYSVYKQDSTSVLRREDICHRCGKDFSRHGTLQMRKRADLLMQERE